MENCEYFKKIHTSIENLKNFQYWNEDKRFLHNIIGICKDRYSETFSKGKNNEYTRLMTNSEKHNDFLCLLVNMLFCRMCKKINFKCRKCKAKDSLVISKSNYTQAICTKCNTIYNKAELNKFKKYSEIFKFEKGFDILTKDLKKLIWNGERWLNEEEFNKIKK
jgi:hypothetical protein